MKNKLLYLLIFIVGGLISCDKDNSADYIFDKSVNERFSDLYSEQNTAFQAPEFGWVGYYNPNGESGACTLLLKFQEDGTVIMHSDWDKGNANDTITYSITKKQDVVLTFESWSVLHDIYEVNNNDNGGEYVFNISDVSSEEAILVSKTDNGYGDDDVTRLVLKPATSENWNLVPIIANVVRLEEDPTKSIFRNFESEGIAFASFIYDKKARSGMVTYMMNDELVSVTVPVVINAEGFEFMSEVHIGDKILKVFTYNLDEDAFVNTDGSIKLDYDDTPAYTINGVADNFLAVNFRVISAYSANLEGAITTLKQDVPKFGAFQTYSEWGYLLCYADGAEGGNWAGFSNMVYSKTGEDEIAITWDGHVFGEWWKVIYDNEGGKQILNFFLDENGLYIVPLNGDHYYLVSKSDPSKYVLY